MMRVSDAAILAGTKLKTRRVRMTITSVIAGLLFIVAICLSLLVSGVIKSVENFNKEGYGSRYLVSLNADPSLGADGSIYNRLQDDKDLQAELELKYKTYKKEKAAYAKLVGAEYDPKNEPPLFEEFDGIKNPNFSVSVLNEFLMQNQGIDSDLINKSADKISNSSEVIASYEVVPIGSNEFGPGSSSIKTEQKYSLNPIIDGQEYGLDDKEQIQYSSAGQPQPLKAFTESLGVADDRLTHPLYFDGINVDNIINENRVPVIAPYEAVQEILGLKPYSDDDSNVTNEQRLERYRRVREDAKGLKFSVCVRNQSSINSLNKAKETQSQQQLAVKDSKLQKPSLLLEAGKDPCSGIAVVKDVRTEDEKKFAIAQEKLENYDTPGLLATPTQRLVEFEVIGIMQGSRSNVSSFSISSIVRELISTRPFGYQIQWAIPESSINKTIPELSTKVAAQQISPGQYGETVKVIELENAAQVKDLMDKVQCDYNFNEMIDPGSFQIKGDSCKEQGRIFSVAPFGSNSVALDQVKSVFNGIFKWVLIVITAISSVILIGIVGKIISDSRRETAVFRAIGAKRFDIAQIYLTYSFFLGSIIAIVAMSIGILIVGFIHNKYSAGLSVDAVISYGSKDLNKTFELYAVDPKQLGVIVFAIIGAALLSALLPLLTNLRRNPIKDMRDER